MKKRHLNLKNKSKMRPFHIRLEEEQMLFLEEQSLPVSEIIRRAIDEYLKRLQSQQISASASKGGQNDS